MVHDLRLPTAWSDPWLRGVHRSQDVCKKRPPPFRALVFRVVEPLRELWAADMKHLDTSQQGRADEARHLGSRNGPQSRVVLREEDERHHHKWVGCKTADHLSRPAPLVVGKRCTVHVASIGSSSSCLEEMAA